MKFVVSVLIFFMEVAVFGEGVILTNGQSYVLSFDSLPYLRQATAFDDSSAGVSFVNDGVDLDESLLFETFPDGSSSASISNLWIGTTILDPNEASVILMTASRSGTNSSPPFPTLRGTFKVTVISGTVNLSGFLVSQVVNGNYYSQLFTAPGSANSTNWGDVPPLSITKSNENVVLTWPQTVSSWLVTETSGLDYSYASNNVVYGVAHRRTVIPGTSYGTNETKLFVALPIDYLATNVFYLLQPNNLLTSPTNGFPPPPTPLLSP